MSRRPAPRPLLLAAHHGFDQLRSDVRAGGLIRVRRGVYVEATNARLGRWERQRLELRELCAAITATTTCLFAFSHETAAALWELEAPPISRVEIVQRSRPSAAMAPDVIRHYRPDLSEADIVQLDGLPVTPIERTAIDCALVSSPPAALAIVDSALRRLAEVSRFQRESSIERQNGVRAHLLERLAERGAVRHVRRGREILSLANGLAESGGESWARWLALVQGLPEPELQMPVETTIKTFYTDGMWTTLLTGGKLIVIEYDGTEKYSDNPGEAVIDQTNREQLIKDATGATIVRFTKRDRRNPNAAATRLLRAFPSGVERVRRPLLLARSPHRRRL